MAALCLGCGIACVARARRCGLGSCPCLAFALPSACASLAPCGPHGCFYGVTNLTMRGPSRLFRGRKCRDTSAPLAFFGVSDLSRSPFLGGEKREALLCPLSRLIGHSGTRFDLKSNPRFGSNQTLALRAVPFPCRMASMSFDATACRCVKTSIEPVLSCHCPMAKAFCKTVLALLAPCVECRIYGFWHSSCFRR